ncbi:hypothetical protein [Dialister sp.]|uniref:hypothetical protein n=1 Tax=Dialister sp. TaxID=1955814 RepID=UPI002E816648|nr:hypothetical protein [Dialister sp.]MEE3453180.1 hypothetical protein [Dialister sp.]
MSEKKSDYFQSRANQYEDYYHLLNHWLEAKNYGASAAEYFEANGWKNIAIYGMGDLANRLMEDLEGTSVRVSYGIDRDTAGTVARIAEVYSPGQKLPSADAVVVTPFYSFDAIKETLGKQVTCPIVSLENVIWSI